MLLLSQHNGTVTLILPRSEVFYIACYAFSLRHSGAAEVLRCRARYQPFGASVTSVHETVYVTSPLLDLRLLNPINRVYHPIPAAYVQVQDVTLG